MAEAIAPELLGRSVGGVNLVPGNLRDQLAPVAEPTLLVFLRHLGCIFCRETVTELRQVSEKEPGFPRVLFFTLGSPTETRVFLRRYWPQARAVSDPHQEFYRGFELGRGSLRQNLGARVWRAQRRAKRKGLANGARVGDIWMMPGVFLVRDAAIVWSHEFEHAGDLPDFACIPDLAAGRRPAADL